MLKIKNKDVYVPFYNNAIRTKIMKNLGLKLYIEVFLKGGRFSGKSYYIAQQIIELMYRDPSMSAIIVAQNINDHYDRGVNLFTKILVSMGLMGEWIWKSKDTNPELIRSVNGYIQRIKFLSLEKLETAGFEPEINPATGKYSFYGIIWDDEMSKKTDNNPEADFAYIDRLVDAITTAKNTFVRHLVNEHSNKTLVTFHSLNPWGEENPLVKKFHDLLGDDVKKLKEKGYNVGYKETDKELKICGTTNYIVNTKLGQNAVDSVVTMKGDVREQTMIYGVTGRTHNSTFGAELTLMESLNNGNNLPNDLEFLPLNLSLDVGSASASAFYLIGADKRYLVRSGGKNYPTRLVARSELVLDPKKDFSSIEQRYKKILTHIYKLKYRYPEITKGINLYVDGSALDAIELMKAYIKELNNEDPSFDLDKWLNVIPQSQKFKKSEQRERRKNRFAEIVGSYGLIVDKKECPEFYEMTAKIVGRKSEQKYDHCWDSLMYGVMPIQSLLTLGLQIKALQNKPRNWEEL